MLPFREWPINPMRPYIKKGRIHSEEAQKRRAAEWIDRWGSILKPCELESVDSSTQSLKGFESKSIDESMSTYFMMSEQVEELEMEIDLTTDEESEDSDVGESLNPISISLHYSGKEDKLKLCSSDDNNNATDSDDDCVPDSPCNNVASATFVLDKHIKVDPAVSNLPSDDATETCNNNNDRALELSPDSSPENLSKENCDTEDKDPDVEHTRPVSRISLMIHPYGDDDNDVSDAETERPLSRMSHSGYMSYFETDYDDDDDDDDDADNREKILKTKKSGSGVYGKIPGINVGSVWKHRRQFSRRSVHRPHCAVIHGGPQGAYSMVLSATYSVNDRGKEFDFYGEGGRDPKTKKHVRDQKMERGNLSLRKNLQTGTPVRVIRGFQLNNEYAPEVGYRYDGLYQVTQCTTVDPKIDGFNVFMFTFVRCGNQPPPPWQIPSVPPPSPQHLSDSDDDINFEAEGRTRPSRKKRRRTPVFEISRNSTPISADDKPPELQLFENNAPCPFVYPIPPRLSPSLLINNGTCSIQKQPVLLLQKLNDDITADAILRPVSVKDVRVKKIMKKNRKRVKAKRDHINDSLKKQQNYSKNKCLEVNDSFLEKKKKTKNYGTGAAKKNVGNLKHSQNKTKRVLKEQVVKKKKLHPKITVVNKNNSPMRVKKRILPKMVSEGKTNVKKVVVRTDIKKNIFTGSLPKKVSVGKTSVKKIVTKIGVKKNFSTANLSKKLSIGKTNVKKVVVKTGVKKNVSSASLPKKVSVGKTSVKKVISKTGAEENVSTAHVKEKQKQSKGTVDGVNSSNSKKIKIGSSQKKEVVEKIRKDRKIISKTGSHTKANISKTNAF